MDDLSTDDDVYFDMDTGKGPGLVEAELIPDGISILLPPNSGIDQGLVMIGLDRNTTARIAYDNNYGSDDPELWHAALTVMSSEYEVVWIFLSPENLKLLYNLIGEFFAGKPPESYVDKNPTP